MFRFLIGSVAGDPDNLSVSFPGGEVSLSKPKLLFVLSPSPIAAPTIRLTTAIAHMIPFITPTTILFLVPSFTGSSIATVVNSQGLIETVPANPARFDHDPVSLALKGLLLEESRTNCVRPI